MPALEHDHGKLHLGSELRRLSTFVLIHGAGDVGWYWHLVETELRERGHDVVAPDLPRTTTRWSWTTTHTRRRGSGRSQRSGRSCSIVGGFTAPLVRRPATGRRPGVRGRHDPVPGRGAQ